MDFVYRLSTWGRLEKAVVKQALRTNHGRKLDELRFWYTDRFDVHITLERKAMFELNVVTAIPVGALAAAIWAVVGIRRMLRSESALGLSRKQRVIVWSVAVGSYPPAFFLGFAGAAMLTDLTVEPSPWNGITMDLTMAFALGFIGAAIVWGSAKLAVVSFRRTGEAR
ncbi:MAG: hypothetical protein O9318_14430 [Hylemonella sp.]|uniref:hypothetical protein n=1 Tax=Hylemonella sp. TaxID=2066020 RepID=UPI0022C01796|nr:hypothetical protein [Hylemonella sp.]MCZ8253662.1 hypothetical protein [Hylemonella sp.]